TLLLARWVNGPKRLLSFGIVVPFAVGAAYSSGLFLQAGPLFRHSMLLDYLGSSLPQGPPLGTLLFLFACLVVLGLWVQGRFTSKDKKSLLAKALLIPSAMIVLAWGSAFVWLFLQM